MGVVRTNQFLIYPSQEYLGFGPLPVGNEGLEWFGRNETLLEMKSTLI